MPLLRGGASASRGRGATLAGALLGTAAACLLLLHGAVLPPEARVGAGTARQHAGNSTRSGVPGGHSHHHKRKPETRQNDTLVPNIVHVIWFYPEHTQLRFHQLLCLLSIQRHLAPRALLLWHAPGAPPAAGAWWAFALASIPSLQLQTMQPPTSIYSHPIWKPEHQADVARIDILIKHGGVYVDLDVVVVAPFTPLLSHPVTLGAETPRLLGSGVILARRRAPFLMLWRQQYQDFNDGLWNEHSVVRPMELARRHPNLVHIDWFRLERPNWQERRWLYEPGRLWDWSQNLAVHLWYREYRGRDHDPNSIRSWNTTAGELFRYIYYGKPDLIPT